MSMLYVMLVKSNDAVQDSQLENLKIQSDKILCHIQELYLCTAQETGRQCQPFLVPMAGKIDLACHHCRIFGCKWNQRLVWLFLPEAK